MSSVQSWPSEVFYTKMVGSYIKKNRLRRFVSIKYDQEFVEIGALGTKLAIVVPRETKKEKGKRKNKKAEKERQKQMRRENCF